MRIIIEIDGSGSGSGTGSDGVRVANASAPASGAGSTEPSSAAISAQMAAINAGPAPVPGSHGAHATSDMPGSDPYAAAHEDATSAGAAPGMA
jgi:hypothetical protein